tara:strand:- start:1725 stop:2060 length:336 start_codon:yes stop_codon:yes gene_type:complete
MTATWTINTLDRQLVDGERTDVVTVIHWDVTDSETVGEGDEAKTYSGRCYGTVALAEPGESFTPYADITEEQAIGWCKAALGNDQVTAYETSVENQISLEKNPTTGTGVPW